MSSVWFTPVTHKNKPTKVLGRAQPLAAAQWLEERLQAYLNEDGASGRTIKRVGSDTVMLYEAGQLTATLHIEHLSPPSTAGRGDNWVKRTEAH